MHLLPVNPFLFQAVHQIQISMNQVAQVHRYLGRVQVGEIGRPIPKLIIYKIGIDMNVLDGRIH